MSAEIKLTTANVVHEKDPEECKDIEDFLAIPGYEKDLEECIDIENHTFVKAGINMAVSLLDEILHDAKVCNSHGIKHAMCVMLHARRALRDNKIYRIPNNTRVAIILAALLHDADDRKFFPGHKKYENARKILEKTFPTIQEQVIRMIELVSSSKNGDSIPEEAKEAPWILWPRYADRIEACGWIGIVRCWEYSVSSGNVLFTEDTPRAKTEGELWEIASYSRCVEYKGKSASMIDHYYDKLLRIGLFESKNVYLDKMAERRNAPPVALCIAFGKTGTMPQLVLDMARHLASTEAESAAEE